jgi:hypothetical protein
MRTACIRFDFDIASTLASLFCDEISVKTRSEAHSVSYREIFTDICFKVAIAAFIAAGNSRATTFCLIWSNGIHGFQK